MEGSEIARLKNQIDQEVQSMKQGLSGYAITSKHDIINHKYDRLGDYQQRLKKYIGETKALEVVIEALNRLGNDRENTNLTKKGTTDFEHFNG